MVAMSSLSHSSLLPIQTHIHKISEKKKPNVKEDEKVIFPSLDMNQKKRREFYTNHVFGLWIEGNVAAFRWGPWER